LLILRANSRLSSGYWSNAGSRFSTLLACRKIIHKPTQISCD
jgi:hypothetical protein